MAQIVWPFDTACVSEWCGGYSGVRTGIHMGTDFAVGQGTELKATMDGTIRLHTDNGHGAGIDIINPDGTVIRNWHISQFNVNNGDYVTIGQVIGLTGGAKGTWGAGNSTGPHLHWELRDNTRFDDRGWIDPRDLSIGSGGGTTSSAPASGSVSDLAAAVLRGDLGNGPARQAALGSRYEEVQAEVNRILSGGAPAPEPVSAANNVVQPGDGYWHIAQRVWGGDNAQIEANMHKLIDLNGNKRLFAGDTVILDAPAPTPVVQPEPVPVAPTAEETKPEVKPESTEHKQLPQGETMEPTKENNTAALERQAAMVMPIKPADLGTIITNNKTRKIVWAIYGLVGLAIVAVMGGLTQAQMLAPQWFLVATGSYTALGPAFSSLAIANISTKKKPK